MATPPTIPKIIHQSWKTKTLPKKMQKNVDKLKAMNPEYTYELSDDSDCRSFLRQHFGENYVHAFDAVKFGMFKCDLWRYAALYVKGGVYIDIDMVPMAPLSTFVTEPFTFIAPIDLCPRAIYQAFLAVAPGHPAILHSLQLAFYNIASRRPILTNDLILAGPLVTGIAVNLYFNKAKTTSSFKTGIQAEDNNMLLIRHEKHVALNESYVIDLHDRKLFRTKYKGYRKLMSLKHSISKFLGIEDYYVDNRDETMKHLYFKIFGLYVLIAGLIIVIAILVYSQMF